MYERTAAHVGHFALLALPAVVIYLGWMKENIDRGVVRWFGVAMPALFPVLEGVRGEAMERWAELMHRWTAYAMLALAAGHVAAIFKHRWLDRDDVLYRMALWTREEKGSA